jgi:hypothetical protein
MYGTTNTSHLNLLLKKRGPLLLLLLLLLNLLFVVIVKYSVYVGLFVYWHK